MALADIIIQLIKTKGAISFHDFMEMALYYPELGYYTSASEKIGANGDFYTSCNLTPLYGAMLARQIEEMWHYMGEKEFTIVEYGAGTGMLCHDILVSLRENERFYNSLKYCIIEKSPAMRKKEYLLQCDKVCWYDSIDCLPEITGCIISNELIDNFAVHKVVMADELMEVYVDYNDKFIEILKPASDELKEYFHTLGITLPKGYCTEVNIESTKWIADVAQSLREGYVITVDYGYHSSELYSGPRREGTLVCYYKHQVNYDPYINIGSQDITTHINFSALGHWGQINGLECTGYTNQAYFLLGLGIREHLTGQLLAGGQDPYAAYKKNAFIVHSLLNDMGPKFKVLIQHKNAPDLPLSGLKLASADSSSLLSADFAHTALL